jgi:hypothetical protein
VPTRQVADVEECLREWCHPMHLTQLEEAVGNSPLIEDLDRA